MKIKAVACLGSQLVIMLVGCVCLMIQLCAGYPLGADRRHSDEASDRSRTTGPVFTFVKTDPNANVKWGVRHYAGTKYQ